jgi:mannobiose 2-epimerase
MRHTVDRENGGFYGAIDCDLRVDRQAPRAAVINARILWTFSAAARVLGDAAYRETADWAYDYIVSKFWDKECGGIYWMLDYLGNPISDRRLRFGRILPGNRICGGARMGQAALPVD